MRLANVKQKPTATKGNNWRVCSLCGALMRGTKPLGAEERLSMHMRMEHPTGGLKKAKIDERYSPKATPKATRPDLEIYFSTESELRMSALIAAAEWMVLPPAPGRSIGDNVRVTIVVGVDKFVVQGVIATESSLSTSVFLTSATPGWSALAMRIMHGVEPAGFGDEL